MALLFYDGFDHYGGTSDMLNRSGIVQYTGVSGSLVTGRNGNAKELNGSITAAVGQRVAQAGIGISAALVSADFVVAFYDFVANATQITVVFRQRNYTIEVWRGAQGSGTLLSTSANNVWAEAQDFVEIWVKIDPSAGTVGVHSNQVSLVSLSGVNTQATANAWWDGFSITGAAIDDLYYADTTTAVNNTFLGDPRVYTQFPTANAAVQFTPLANTNWQEVSETAFDGDTSYNSDSTVGHEDLFTIGATPATITNILALAVTGAYRKDDAGTRKIKQALKSSATEVYGATNALPDTSYVYLFDVFPTDPATAVAWTRTGVNAATPGYNLAA